MDVKKLATYNKWISQFNLEDKQYASLLADSLIFIEESDMKNELADFLRKNFPHPNKTALYSIFDTPIEKKSLNGKITERYKYPFFEEKKREKNPNYFVDPKNTGSESVINLFIKAFCQNEKNFYKFPNLNTICNKQIHNIVLINDIGGSGEQTIKFLKWFYHNSTIKSWTSSKHIKIFVLLYACSQNSYKNITENLLSKKINLKIHVCKFISSEGSKLWTQQQRNKIIELCKNYAKIGKLNNVFRLGYKKSFSLLAFSYKTPNNVPAILWDKTNKWEPLLTERPDINGIQYFISTLYSLPSLFNQFNIKFKTSSFFLSSKKNCISVLFVIKKYRIHEPRIISSFLDISYEETINALTRLNKMKLIFDNNYITVEGEKVIKKLRKKNNNYEHTIEDCDDFYYPISIRDSD